MHELTIVRKKLITLAEIGRIGKQSKRKERVRRRSAFIGNPFAFIKRLLDQKWSCHLTCPVEDIDPHLSATVSNTSRDQDPGPCKTLVTPPDLVFHLNSDEPTLAKVNEADKAARS